MKNFSLQIDNSWTLFIDRDGVLNHEKKEDYILNWSEFIFYDGVKEAMNILSKKFGKIILVTNQKGVGKGLMSENDLQNIHINMTQELSDAGGRIDGIYYCISLDNDSPYRKPNAGMAFMAKEKYDAIDFKKSIMVGNKLTDMGFGRNAGMQTVFVATTNPEYEFPHPSTDFRFMNLLEFAKSL